MIKQSEYRRESYHESTGSAGVLGVQVMVALNRELTEKEREAVNKFVYHFHNLMVEESVRLDPQEIEYAAKEKEELLSLFDIHQPIYVEEVPNEYSRQISRPWFVVTTKVGRIKIGWRKRVIVIDWSDTNLKVTADELFKDEDVTKGEKMIHAWGYEKAAEYLVDLLG